MTLKTSNLKTYRVFISMHHRCSNPRCQSFPRYGGRGIRVALEWATFEAFLADMGPQPAGYLLDRINNDGPYAPGNCRWATRIQSARNTGSNHMVTAFGRTACISEWAQECGIHKTALLRRIQVGWHPEAALTIPSMRGSKSRPLMRQAGLSI